MLQQGVWKCHKLLYSPAGLIFKLLVYNLKCILRLNGFLLLDVAADKVPDGGPARDVDLGVGTLNV